MAKPTDFGPRVFRASALVVSAAKSPSIDGAPWPPHGRLVELAGGIAGACSSMAVAAVVAAQDAGEIVAWLQPRHGLLFPPDLYESGVDLEALVVIHVPTSSAAKEPSAAREPSRGPSRRAAVGCHDLPKAAELLLRSGGFDLLVLDLRPVAPPRGAWAGRLQGLAREHQCRVLLLTDARLSADLGCAVSQRLEPRRRREGGFFVVESQVVRDKLHAASHPASIHRRGPTGLP